MDFFHHFLFKGFPNCQQVVEDGDTDTIQTIVKLEASLPVTIAKLEPSLTQTMVSLELLTPSTGVKLEAGIPQTQL